MPFKSTKYGKFRVTPIDENGERKRGEDSEDFHQSVARARRMMREDETIIKCRVEPLLIKIKYESVMVFRHSKDLVDPHDITAARVNALIFGI
jgi:hypothetical protein